MRRASDFLDVVDATITQAVKHHALYNSLDEDFLDGRFIRIEGKKMVNFGSCSYLGLEIDPRLKQGIVDAALRYGSQFSSSRAYLEIPLYAEIEKLLAQLFGAPTLVTPSTSLGHITALPVLIREDDAVILDQQVHHSVQTASNLLRPQGTHIEMIRHNRMDQLEEKLVELAQKHRHVWYLADGVYSMFGDLAPLEDLERLLERYPQFHLYIDDAHGMSWCGKNGRGYVLGRLPSRERLIVATSLNKSFAASGGALVFANEELKRRVRVCGGPTTFAGPIQPPMMGALLASARIHLSDELRERQEGLRKKIKLCNRLIQEYRLPVISPSEAPIRYIGMGLPRIVFNMINRLMGEGFYTNAGLFPAVPIKRGGIRFTLTDHQTNEDIEGLIEAMARHLPAVLEEEESSLGEIEQSFRKALPPAFLEGIPTELTKRIPEASSLTLQHETTIEAIAREEWDRLLGKNGIFTWDGLRFLEGAFRENPLPEDNWNFHYYLVRDRCGSPILATFFTDALWKDDMISPESTSLLIEQKRLHDPYFLTSRTFAMGSLLSEGNHLYLDRRENWQQALEMLLKAVEREREGCGATKIALRDFPSEDAEMDDFLLNQGFAKFPMPDSLTIELDWKDEEEFRQGLSQKARRHHRREILPWRPAYEIEVLNAESRKPSDQELEHFNWLYRNVHARGLLLNSFPLPCDIFARAANHPGWELLLLYLKPECGGPSERKPVGVLASFLGPEQYVPLFIGLDYAFVETHRTYRIALDQCVRRAEFHQAKRIFFGFGAPVEKMRFGARKESRNMYVQSVDSYDADLLVHLMKDTGGKRQ